MFRSFLNCFKNEPPVRVAVDLTHLVGGGLNGGIKPFVFEFLQWIAKARGREFIFIYFTKSSLVAEVEAFRRDVDWQVCVGESDGVSLPVSGQRQGLVAAPGDTAGWRRRWPADVLYTPLGYSEFRQAGLPWITLIVDTLHRDVPDGLTVPAVAFRETWIRDGVVSADAVQCISHFAAGQLQRYYGADAAKLFVTHCVVRERLRAEDGSASAPKRPGAPPYFFYPANDWPHKNHPALLEAYAEYRREAGAKAWDLVLSGHFTQPEVGGERIAALGLAGSCRILGHIGVVEFAEVFRSAGALVFPSLYEGFGIPVLEAMAFGVPVACSREGSLPEVAGEAALFFDARRPEDIARALREISQDAGLRERLIAAGKRRAADFVVSREAGRLADRFVALGRLR